MTIESDSEADFQALGAAALETDWRQDLDSGLGEFVAAKGWRSVSDALNSYRHLERMMGGERLSLPAADAGDEAWAPVWDKLGRPKEAAGYSFDAPKDRPYDAGTADWFRQMAHRIGLTATQARSLHDGFLARLTADTANAPPVTTEPVISGPVSSGPVISGPVISDPVAKADFHEADLREIWGRKYDSNMASARRAYAAFLVDESPFHDVADALGETALMELLAKVGRLIGEDSITSRAEGSIGPRSPAEALAEIAKLQRAALTDGKHPYVSKTHPEHQDLVKRMEALYALAYGS